MAGPIYQFPEQKTPSSASVDRIYTSAMTGMYAWTTLWLLIHPMNKLSKLSMSCPNIILLVAVFQRVGFCI